MSIADRIQAINDHLIDDYKVLRLAGADLTRVNKNIVNLKMSWKERLLYFMNNGTDEVWNNWDKVSGTGTTLSLNNTEEAPMSLIYKGNTSQTGTPTPTSPIPVQVVSGDNTINVVGKNLVKSKNVSSYLTQFGTALQIEADLQPSTTYTISFYGTDGNSLYLNEKLFTYNSLNIGTERASIQATTKSTISKSDATQYTEGYGWIIFKNNRNQSSANVFDDLQVELGNQATTYEEYKSASYPISLGDKELCKIGTYQDKIDKSTGKNLINVANISGSLSGQYYQNYETSYTLEVGKTYTLSLNANVSVTPFLLTVGAGEAGYVRDIYTEGGKQNGRISITFTPTSANLENATKLFIRCPRYNSATTTTYTLSDIMLNEGSTALPYEPYGTGWYLKKEIGKVVLNGSEAWVNLNYAYYSTVLNNLIKNIVTADQNIYVLADHFKGESAYEAGTQGTTGIYSVNTQLYLRGYNSTYADINALKTFLSGNNTIVYYVLATPTYETITDTTLLSQLEALKKSYESVTNISQVNNDLPFELNITALSNE